ncbi:hypothetical protein [Nocardia sp. CNY236]|uniref:hypothetical protein n=1 Tax=Nocardia sp. CNY236 TaxID=1169152 RepID=UPI000423BDEC|nr:hypothetical protein [Nocardia sp. CNY236]
MADSAARASADGIRRELAGYVSGTTDPSYAPDREVFGAYTHQQIWNSVHEALDPSTLGRTAAAWQANATMVAAAFQAFSDVANREFARWSGRAADAAVEATRQFVRAGEDAHDVCRAVARLMELNSDAAQTTRNAIAPPQQYRPLDDPAAEAVYGGKRRMEHDCAAADSEADARDAMTYVYNPTMPATGDHVPSFPRLREGPAAGDGDSAGPDSVPGGSAR